MDRWDPAVCLFWVHESSMGGLTIDSTRIVTAQVNFFSYFISSDDYPVPVKHLKLHISIEENYLSGYPPSPSISFQFK